MDSLFIEKFSSLTVSVNSPVLVLLHGWQADSTIWQSVLPIFRQSYVVWCIDLPGCGRNQCVESQSLTSTVALIADFLPEQAILLGWSLGGNVALHIAHQYPQKVSAVITVATNPCFVANTQWPGMPEPTFEAFVDSCVVSAEKTRQRFVGLQVKGDSNEKTLLKFLRNQPQAQWQESQLLAGLHWLKESDTRSWLPVLTQPILQLFAEQDHIVPIACADAVKALAPNVHVTVVSDAGHISWVARPALIEQPIRHFLSHNGLMSSALTSTRDKSTVAESFGRAACSYDGVAHLQRRSAEKLMAMLPQQSAAVVLDIGSGSGWVSDKLAQCLPSAALIAMDLSEGMVRFSRQRYASSAIQWVCADAENVPFAHQSIDVIFTNWAIQWCENLPALFAEMYRILAIGGEAFIATLGPETLYELRHAWSAIDSAEHVNQFVSREVLQASIASAGFEVMAWHECVERETFTQVHDLLIDLKLLGAHNVNRGRPRGLKGRNTLQQLEKAYPITGENGCEATWQLWFIHLRKR